MLGGRPSLERNMSITVNMDSPDDQIRNAMLKEQIRKQYQNEAENVIVRYDNLDSMQL